METREEAACAGVVKLIRFCTSFSASIVVVYIYMLLSSAYGSSIALHEMVILFVLTISYNIALVSFNCRMPRRIMKLHAID